jgi:hypothetical protein
MLLFNFTYTVRCFRVPQVEDHWTRGWSPSSINAQRRVDKLSPSCLMPRSVVDLTIVHMGFVGDEVVSARRSSSHKRFTNAYHQGLVQWCNGPELGRSSTPAQGVADVSVHFCIRHRGIRGLSLVLANFVRPVEHGMNDEWRFERIWRVVACPPSNVSLSP